MHVALFGEVLKHYRLAASLTQEELAEQAGVSRLTISALERGVRRVPHKDTLRRLTAALRLPARDRDRLENAARKTGGNTPFVLGDHAAFSSSINLLPLVGRSWEMDLVERYIEGEGPRLLVVTGEPGIGKTRLLQEAETYARQYGFRVLRGDSYRRRVEEPYAPISEALAHHLSAQAPMQRRGIVRSFPWLVRMLPELTNDLGEALPTLPRHQELRLMFEAAAEYLSSPETDAGAHSLGTLLVLDDLQWAGPDALELLSALVRSGSQPAANRAPLRIIGAYRDTESQWGNALSTMLADLVPGRFATELSLGPLGQAESTQLLALLLTGNEQETIDSIQRLAGGMPFFLIGLAQEARLGRHGVPLDLMHSIRSRMTSLTEEAQEILEIASLMGSSVSHELLLQVSARSEDSVAQALDALHRAKLLVMEDEAFSRFPNEVIRQVAEEGIGSASRRLLRRRIAAAGTAHRAGSG
jgi:transcriptional regulator with XRE-family HTH domain